MELIISIDRLSQLHHILETPISLDSGIKRHAITFVGIFKKTLRSTIKNQFPDGQPKCSSSIGTKGHDATRIHQKLSRRLGHTLPADSTITGRLRKLERGDDIPHRPPGSGRLPDDHIDTLITSALEQCAFHSVCTLCFAIKHPRRTVWRDLHSAGFIVHNLRLVPHELSPLKRRNELEWQLNYNTCLYPPNIAPGGIF
jgi:hypothetical protein